ncbi:MAG: peptide chain release factor N(5)-glutamine methyltransferase [Actinomycetota bacterium]
MRPSEVLLRAMRYLDAHGVEGSRENAETLLARVLGTNRAGLYTRSEGLSSGEARAFGRALCQRCTGTPLQHLIGEQQFRSLALEVRPGVFVPRPETELIVDAALAAIEKTKGPNVVDVGTGTGAIALAVKAERSDTTVVATDRSPEAVALAADNAARLGLEVTVVGGDLFSEVPGNLKGEVDLVVSNPPYVAEKDYEDLPAEVRADPFSALVGGTDMYRELVVRSAEWLRPGGSLIVEIGPALASEIADVFREAFVDIRVLPDLTGRDRMVGGVYR